MNIRKLIETNQENEVVCDNTNCDFAIKNISKDPDKDSKRYVNVACPRCGDNLLTQEDYDQYIAVMTVVNWINRWFSWVTIFTREPKQRQCIKVHVHEGVKIHEENDLIKE